ETARHLVRDRAALAVLDGRLAAAQSTRLRGLSDRLEALERMRQTLGYSETLKRGYAVVWGDGAVVTSKAAAEKAASLEVQFHDGRLALGGRGARGKKPTDGTGQGSLF
ncbi:MAG: exodeoxyribonuclease VII large subunit, partial [Paracoccaceae bacterium]